MLSSVGFRAGILEVLDVRCHGEPVAEIDAVEELRRVLIIEPGYERAGIRLTPIDCESKEISPRASLIADTRAQRFLREGSAVVGPTAAPSVASLGSPMVALPMLNAKFMKCNQRLASA